MRFTRFTSIFEKSSIRDSMAVAAVQLRGVRKEVRHLSTYQPRSSADDSRSGVGWGGMARICPGRTFSSKQSGSSDVRPGNSTTGHHNTRSAFFLSPLRFNVHVRHSAEMDIFICSTREGVDSWKDAISLHGFHPVPLNANYINRERQAFCPHASLPPLAVGEHSWESPETVQPLNSHLTASFRRTDISKKNPCFTDYTDRLKLHHKLSTALWIQRKTLSKHNSLIEYCCFFINSNILRLTYVNAFALNVFGTFGDRDI